MPTSPTPTPAERIEELRRAVNIDDHAQDCAAAMRGEACDCYRARLIETVAALTAQTTAGRKTAADIGIDLSASVAEMDKLLATEMDSDDMRSEEHQISNLAVALLVVMNWPVWRDQLLDGPQEFVDLTELLKKKNADLASAERALAELCQALAFVDRIRIHEDTPDATVLFESLNRAEITAGEVKRVRTLAAKRSGEADGG